MIEIQGDTRRRRSLSGRIAAGVLYVALSAPPFLFGSREPIFVAWWCAILGAGLIFAPTRRLLTGHLVVLAVLAVIALCFGFVLHEQLSDHPWIAHFNPIWARASKAFDGRFVPSVSIVKNQPFLALGPSLANMLALVLGLLVGVDTSRARRAIRVMAWAGIGYGLYGILALLLDPSEILWRAKTAYEGSLTATFVNRNTAACYFGSCATVWFIFLLRAVRDSLPRGRIEWMKVPGHLLVGVQRRVLVRFILVFVCLSALFMTGSRAGVMVSLMILMLTFLIYFRRDLPRGKGLLVALLGCATVGVVVLQIFGGSVGTRIDEFGLNDAGRIAAYRSTLNIISSNPWFGTGLGTFPAAFPPYRSGAISMWGVWDMAHSTPLELASEMGVPFASLIGVAWVAALATLCVGLRIRHHDEAVPLAALAVSLIALLHSLVDFSLQIPGYSIVVFALLGVGLSQTLVGMSGAPSLPRRRRKRSGGSVPGAGLRSLADGEAASI
jgi:O-antigen ligase